METAEASVLDDCFDRRFRGLDNATAIESFEIGRVEELDGDSAVLDLVVPLGVVCPGKGLG